MTAISDASLLGHVGERPIAIVVEQLRGGEIVVRYFVQNRIARLFTANKEIEISVVIIVGPAARLRWKLNGTQSRLIGRVGECAVAVVANQGDRLPPAVRQLTAAHQEKIMPANSASYPG